MKNIHVLRKLLQGAWVFGAGAFTVKISDSVPTLQSTSAVVVEPANAVMAVLAAAAFGLGVYMIRNRICR